MSVLLNGLLPTHSFRLSEYWDGFAYTDPEVIKGRDYIYSFPYLLCLAQWLAQSHSNYLVSERTVALLYAMEKLYHCDLIWNDFQEESKAYSLCYLLFTEGKIKKQMYLQIFAKESTKSITPKLIKSVT